jgi:large subunit ribosomal protein LX
LNWEELKKYLDFWSEEMAEKSFWVQGTCKIGDEWKPYTKVIEAPNERLAEERVYTLIGSKHRLKRSYIKVDTIRVYDGE